MQPSRTIAIGDIHGCWRALELMLEEIQPAESDRIIMLGDAIDRGPGSRQVLDRLISLQEQCELISILGNHEQMLLDAISGRIPLQSWLMHGGAETLDSYGRGAALSSVPANHREFIESWSDYCETDGYFFAHGNYLPQLPLAAQPWEELRWESLHARLPGVHCSGKTAVVGHTSNKRGEIVNVGHLVCIDTYCCGGKWLTALEPTTGEIWQTSESGEYRAGSLPPPR